MVTLILSALWAVLQKPVLAQGQPLLSLGVKKIKSIRLFALPGIQACSKNHVSLVEGKRKGGELPLIWAKERLPQRAWHKEKPAWCGRAFALVLGSSCGSTNQLRELDRSLTLSEFQFPVYKLKMIIPALLACQGCCNTQMTEGMLTSPVSRKALARVLGDC